MPKATPVLNAQGYPCFRWQPPVSTLHSENNLSINNFPEPFHPAMSYVLYVVFVIFFVMFKLTSRRFHQSNQLPFIKIIKLIK